MPDGIHGELSIVARGDGESREEPEDGMIIIADEDRKGL